ncbi:hypothetical protein TNCV_548031 [Trichonephila clavipes]|nr:hypothetical protein TNCV_548031 [Trichonephila clavipes]
MFNILRVLFPPPPTTAMTAGTCLAWMEIIGETFGKQFLYSKSAISEFWKFERKFLRRKRNPAVYFQVDDHVDPGNSLAAVSSENHDLHTEICYHLPSWAME